jgi:glycosyltransferase involved in cell wall biosynthesis
MTKELKVGGAIFNVEEMMTPEISICIPTYECRGKGTQYLSELFLSLKTQSYQGFEIVISDHSIDNEIFDFCESQSHFEITYIRNPNDRGNPAANTNCALQHAENKIIKIMYQDDLFVNDDALHLIKSAFDCGASWVMNGFTHTTDGQTFFRPMIPQWTEELLIGRNSLGSPSCFAILNKLKEEMDANLTLLIDTELYYRIEQKLGKPTIIQDVLIANREHSYRVSSNINYDIQINHPNGTWLMNKKEYNYVIKKHNKPN